MHEDARRRTTSLRHGGHHLHPARAPRAAKWVRHRTSPTTTVAPTGRSPISLDAARHLVASACNAASPNGAVASGLVDARRLPGRRTSSRRSRSAARYLLGLRPQQPLVPAAQASRHAEARSLIFETDGQPDELRERAGSTIDDQLRRRGSGPQHLRQRNGKNGLQPLTDVADQAKGRGRHRRSSSASVTPASASCEKPGNSHTAVAPGCGTTWRPRRRPAPVAAPSKAASDCSTTADRPRRTRTATTTSAPPAGRELGPTSSRPRSTRSPRASGSSAALARSDGASLRSTRRPGAPGLAFALSGVRVLNMTLALSS